MGCRNSKPFITTTTTTRRPKPSSSSTSLVDLCRQRRDLIAEAVDLRFALAASHAAYFDSLFSLSDALHHFADSELAPSSPLVVLPPSSKPKSIDADEKDEDQHLPLSSHSSSPLSSPSPSRQNPNPNPNPNPDPNPIPIPSPSPNPKFSRNSSMEAPKMVYRSPSPYFVGSSSMGVPSMGFGDPFMGFEGFGGFGMETEEGTSRVMAGTPPPPSPGKNSGWDFLDPFNSYEKVLPDYYYNYNRFDGSVFIASPDLSEVRRQEGIPELEEELEEKEGSGSDDGSFYSVENGSMGSGLSRTKSGSGSDGEGLARTKSGSGGDGLSRTKSGSGGDDGGLSRTKSGSVGDGLSRTKSGSGGDDAGLSRTKSGSGGNGGGEGLNGKKKGVTFEDVALDVEDRRTSDGKSLSEVSEGKSLSEVSDGKSLSEASDGSSLFVQKNRDIMEVVREIKLQFEYGAACGEEVSRLLEVGKLQYQYRNRMKSVFCSQILNPGNLSLLPTPNSSFRWSKGSTSFSRRAETKTTEPEVEDYINAHSLSTALEKLSIWEEKLYKEVKDEEKLRRDYERKYKKLKRLDQKGAEPSEIHSTRASVRELSTKISIVIKSVDTISRKVHKIRDEELQPQLIKLIEGFIRMWKALRNCHKKQLQAIQSILISKGHRLSVRTGNQRKDVGKATYEFLQEITNWYHCFNNWIIIQNLCIESINGWLMKWLPDEREETADGLVPFSPSRIQAPTVFIISNDLSHAIKTIPAESVANSMRDFIGTINYFLQMQGEERRQKRDAEYLSRAYDRKVKLMMGSGTDGHIVMVSDKQDGLEQHDDPSSALSAMKKRLDEKIKEHNGTLGRLQFTASNTLPKVLAPLFESLQNFAAEVVKAYGEVRIPVEGA